MYSNNPPRHPPPHQMYAPPVSAENLLNIAFYQNVSKLQVIQPRDSYNKGPSIGSGPQFYTKPPTSIPANQTIEFDEGPKITVFIGLLADFSLLDVEL